MFTRAAVVLVGSGSRTSRFGSVVADEPSRFDAVEWPAVGSADANELPVVRGSGVATELRRGNGADTELPEVEAARGSAVARECDGGSGAETA
ncbi:MAG TPA: hypothetical protein VIA18_02790, partial [Polyangia bacterium]|nr:hypothetical protein [Polyangia bacterium]